MNFPLVTPLKVYIYISILKKEPSPPKDRFSSSRVIQFRSTIDSRSSPSILRESTVYFPLCGFPANCLFLDQRDFLDVSLKIVLPILCVVAFSRGRQTNSNTGPLYLLIKSRWTSVTDAYTTRLSLCRG